MERRAGGPSQPASKLGLTDAGRPDHDDVLRRDFVAKVALDLLTAPAVAHRDRDGALRVVLTDDVSVELDDDLRRRELGLGLRSCGHGSSSIVSDVFV